MRRRLLGLLRRLTQFYPLRHGAYLFNQVLGHLGLDGDQPVWLASPAAGEMPPMVLNVASRHERKLFLFPRTYGRHYARTPLAGFLRAHARPGAVVLDIGANVGCYSRLAAGLVGTAGHVYAFEPSPEICESLRRSIAAGQAANVTPVEIALGDEERVAELHRAKDSPATSLVAEAPGQPSRYDGGFSVRVRRLDDWARDEGIDAQRISAIKVDVEGHEAHAVAGMLGTLERAGRPPMWIEVRGPRGSKRAPGTAADVARILGTIGYRPHRWGPAGPSAPIDVATVIGQEDLTVLADQPSRRVVICASPSAASMPQAPSTSPPPE